MNLPLRRLILVSILASIACRFLFLDRFPAGISHDEVEYVLSSASYAFTGTDLSGIGFPLSLFKTETHGHISPIPPLFLAPYFYFIPVNQFSARLPYILISLLTIFVLYTLCVLLFKSSSLALVVTFIFTVSPWGFYLSRWAADTPFALLFFLWGIYFFLSENKWKFSSSVLLFILGFFSYNGAKLLFFPLLLFLLFYRWKINRAGWFSRTIFLKLIGAVSIFFFGYFVISYLIPGSIAQERDSEIVFLNSKLLQEKVNYLREQELEFPLNYLFINKFTVALQIMLEKYVSAFSAISLFATGDPDIVYRTDLIGLFLPFELVTIFVGMYYLRSRYRREAFLLMGLTLLAPLATTLSGNSTSILQRSFLLLPLLSIYSGAGIYCSYLFASRSINFRIVSLVWGSIIGLFFITFLHFYFFQWPMLSLEGFTLQGRLGAEYLHRFPKNSEIKVIATNSRGAYLQYIFFSEPATQRKFFQNRFDDFLHKNYSIETLLFTDHCPDFSEPEFSYLIQREASPCKRIGFPNAEIVSQRDLKMLLQIHSDKVCVRLALNVTKARPRLWDFDFLAMSNERFCRTWLSN